MPTVPRHASQALTALFLVACLVGLVAAIRGYGAPESGIDGTPGAILVIASTLSLLVAGLLVGFARLGRRWRLTLELLILLGLAGTLFAGWLLMAWTLVAAIVAALAFDLLRLVWSASAPRHA